MSITVIPVAAAVIRRGDRFLLTQRMSDKQFANQWEFPGGKLEAGETPQQALERELREELAAETRAGNVQYVCQNNQYMVLFFETELLSDVLRFVEVQDARFVTVEEARCMDMTSQDREAMERLLRAGRLV